MVHINKFRENKLNESNQDRIYYLFMEKGYDDLLSNSIDPFVREMDNIEYELFIFANNTPPNRLVEVAIKWGTYYIISKNEYNLIIAEA